MLRVIESIPMSAALSQTADETDSVILVNEALMYAQYHRDGTTETVSQRRYHRDGANKYSTTQTVPQRRQRQRLLPVAPVLSSNSR